MAVVAHTFVFASTKFNAMAIVSCAIQLIADTLTGWIIILPVHARTSDFPRLPEGAVAVRSAVFFTTWPGTSFNLFDTIHGLNKERLAGGQTGHVLAQVQSQDCRRQGN